MHKPIQSLLKNQSYEMIRNSDSSLINEYPPNGQLMQGTLPQLVTSPQTSRTFPSSSMLTSDGFRQGSGVGDGAAVGVGVASWRKLAVNWVSSLMLNTSVLLDSSWSPDQRSKMKPWLGIAFKVIVESAE